MKKRSDGRYVETITIGGKRKYIYGSSPAQVKKKLREFEEDASSGHSFGEIADDWYAKHCDGLRYNTQMFYKPLLDHAKEHFGDRNIEDIDTQSISEWLQSLNPQYSRKSITNHKSTMIMIMAHALSLRYISFNPARDAIIPKNARKMRRTLPDDDKIIVIDKTNGEGDALLAYLLLYSGCRRNEALALQFKHLDIERGMIVVTQQLVFKNNRPQVVDNVKTDAGIRIAYMHPKLTAVLKEINGNPNDFVFGGDQPWSETKYRRTWERFCKESGLCKPVVKKIIDKDGKPVETILLKPSVTPHQLRHAYATMCYEVGLDPKLAASIMGHEDTKTLEEIYQHLRVVKTDEARQKIASFSWV